MKYPHAAPQPETVSYGRVSYSDAFRWLEEDSAAALDFQARQDRLSQDWIASRPAHARATALIEPLPRINTEIPVLCGGRWFRLHTPEGRERQVIEVADDIHGSWRTVIDLNADAAQEAPVINVFQPSPDGTKLLIIGGSGGRECEYLRVLDGASGEPLLASIPQARPLFAAWMADSSGFYYSAYEPADMMALKVYRQRLDAAATTQAETLAGTPSVPWVKAAGDGRHALLMSEYLNSRPDYLRDEATDGAWRPFLLGESAMFRGGIVGDRYYAITDDGAPRGRLVSIPLATPRDRSTWQELIAESDAVLGTLIVVGQTLVLADLVDTWSRLRAFDIDGQPLGDIPLPGRGTLYAGLAAPFGVVDAVWKGGDHEVLFQYAEPARSPALYRADLRSRKPQALTEAALQFDATVRDFWTLSADGARVPYQVISRAGLDLERPHPTIVWGYGGFNIAVLPTWYGILFATWIRAGGIFVIAHLRGGGELGPQMWHQGRLKLKQNSFNDLHAIGDDLVARAITTSAQLGVIGSSNGGVMAATAVVQRPDLHRASISAVPLTDILGRARNPVTVVSTFDYGDPNDPEMSEVLLRWSPYQNVRDGVCYPALYLTAGAVDPRCPPWHVRKMAARMQQATAGPNPVLMRVRANQAHGAVGSAEQKARDIDFLTFFADQLGLAL